MGVEVIKYYLSYRANTWTVGVEYEHSDSTVKNNMLYRGVGVDPSKMIKEARDVMISWKINEFEVDHHMAIAYDRVKHAIDTMNLGEQRYTCCKAFNLLSTQ